MIFFVLRGGRPWRMLPEHFPPHQTAYRWFTRFRDDGTWEILNHHLVMRIVKGRPRGQSQRRASWTAERQTTEGCGSPRDMMLARRSMGASVMRWSILMAEG